MPCESRCVRNIHLLYWCRLFAIERNGSYSNAALKLKKFSFIKIPIWDLSELDDHKLTRFPFELLDDDGLCLCNLRGKEQLAKKLSDDFSAKNRCASWYSWFFRQKLAFGLLRELLYNNETVKHWARARGNFAALGAKEWKQKRTQRPILTIGFAIENKTQTQQTKHSVIGALSSILTWTPRARNRLCYSSSKSSSDARGFSS